MLNPNQPPAQPGAPGAAPAAPAGPVVCIAAQGDGTFMVYPEDQGPDAGQPAQDIESAAQLAASMLAGDGQPQDTTTAEDADALFQGGFNGVRGAGLGK
jgi:hypothetical protein